jgi:hypothetical protein
MGSTPIFAMWNNKQTKKLHNKQNDNRRKKQPCYQDETREYDN